MGNLRRKRNSKKEQRQRKSQRLDKEPFYQELDEQKQELVKQMYEFKELSFNTKCASCPKRDTLQVHHVVSKQQLKKMGRKDLLWDRQNGLPLCELCHARHESAFKRVLRDNLRPENIDFALELDLGWYIERHYPKKEE